MAINAGVLSVGNVNALGSGTITFTGNSTLQSAVATGTFANPMVINAGVTGTFDSLSNSNTLSGAISGTGGFTKIGLGTLILAGNNTYTGTTSILGGAVQVSSITNTLGNGSGGSVTLSSGTFIQAIVGNYFPTWPITVGAGGGTVLGTGSNGRWFFAVNSFYGSGTLTLQRSGNFSRFDSNSASQTNYSGKWVVDGVNVDDCLGNVWGKATGDDVITVIDGGNISMRSGVIGSGTQGFTIGSGGGTFGGTGGSINTIVSKISSNGTDRVTFSINSGTTILSNTANSYSGDTYASGVAGTNYLQLGAAGVIPNGAGKGNLVLVNGGGAVGLDMNGFNQTINGLSNYNGTSYSTDSFVDNRVTNSTVTLTAGNNDATSTFSGVIKNSGTNAVLALTKTGTGTLTLGGVNTYIGQTTISGGTLQITDGSIATSSGILNNAALVLNQVNNSRSYAITISGSGTLTKIGSNTLTLTGSNGYTGATNINSGILNVGGTNALAGGGSIAFAGGTLQYSVGNQVDYSGRVVGSGSAIGIDTNGQNVIFASSLAGSNTAGLTKSGSGTLTLSTSNGFIGTVLINAGVLSVGNVNALGSGTTTFAGNSTLQSAVATGTFANPMVINAGVTGTFDSLSNANTLSGAISGTGGFTKIGLGTLILAGNNTYTGTTSILGGAVQVGSITNTLGSGSGGSVTLSSGTLIQAIAGSYSPTWAITVGAGGGNVLGTGSNGRWFFAANSFYGSGTLTLQRSGNFSRFDSNSVSQNNYFGKWVIDTTYVDDCVGNVWGKATGDDVITFINNGSILMRGGVIGSGTQGFTVGSGGGTFSGANASINTIASKISSTGTDRVTFSVNSGTTILSNTANSYSGDTYVSGVLGTNYLQLGVAGVIPNGAGKGNLVLVNGGGAAGLDMNSFSQTINGLSNFNGTSYTTDSIVDNLAANTTATLTVGNNDATSTFSGVIKNSGSNAVLALAKIGAGTLTLGGANSYSGGTTLNSGMLSVGSATALGTGTLTFTGNSTLQSTVATGTIANAMVISPGVTGTFDSNTNTLSGAISGDGAFTKTGLGNLTLSGSNSYTGSTTIGSGYLILGNSNALTGSGNITFAGGLLQFTATNTVDYSGRIKNSTGPIDLFTNNQTITFAGNIDSSNVGGLILPNSYGTLILAGSNSYRGTTQLINATLALANPYALAGGGDIRFTGFGILQFSGSNTQDYSGRFKNSTAAINLDTNGQAVTFASAIDSSNTGGLSKLGSGTLALSSSNGFTGPVAINAGVLSVGNVNALGSGTITFTGSSTLQSAVASGTFANPLVINTGVTGAFDSLSNTNTLSGAISGAGGFTKIGSGTLVLAGSNTYAGTTSILGGAVQVGSITNTLGNGSGGSVTLSSGTFIQAIAGNYFPTWPITVGAGGGTVLGTGSNGRWFFAANSFYGSGTLTLQKSGNFNRFDSNSVSQNNFLGKWVVDAANVDDCVGNVWGKATGDDVITFINNGSILMRGGPIGSSTQGFTVGSGGGSFNGTGGSINTIASKISSTGTDRVTFLINAGTTILSNTANSYSGDTYAFGVASTNYLQLGAAGVIPNGAGKGNLVLVNGGGAVGLDMNGFNQTINGLSNYNGTTYSADSFVDNLAANTTATLTVGNNDATSTFSGVISNSGSNAVLALTKTGTGTLTLAGVNTYSGQTTINAGTLQINDGSIAGSSGILNNATLVYNLVTNAQTYGTAIAGTGALTKTGSNTLTLTGSNSYTGPTNINSGTLNIGSADALAGGGNITFGGGALQYSAGNQADYSGRIVGSSSAIAIDTNGQNVSFASSLASSNTGSLTKSGSGTLALSNSNGITGPVIINAGTLSVGNVNALGSGTTTFAGNSTLQSAVASGTFANPMVINTGVTGTFDSLSNTNTLSGAISGAGGLTKIGAGTLVLAGSNTYTGTTSILGGAVQVSGITNTLGNGSGGSVTLNGGELTAAIPGNYFPSWAITVGAGGGAILGTGSSGRWYFAANQFRGSGTVTLTKGSSNFGRFDAGGQTQPNFSGKWVIDGTWLDGAQGSVWGTATGDDVVTLTNSAFIMIRGGTAGNATQGFTVGTGGGSFNSPNDYLNTIAGKISSSGTDRVTFSLGNRGVTVSNTSNSYSQGFFI